MDEGDRAFRASRGNFGLVWVQGKGFDYAPYARWTRIGADMWPDLAEKLKYDTGIDVHYSRPGGLEFCLEAADWENLDKEMQLISRHTDFEFNYEMLGHSQLKKLIPQISDAVLGACFCPHDGHVNPLYLLRAFHQQMDARGVHYLPESRVIEIVASAGGFKIQTDTDVIASEKIILCSGLDNHRLGQMVDIDIPVSANRGQLLITERVPQFLEYPTLHVRQTAEGGLQIGDSKENAGLDDHTTSDVVRMLAARAVRIFPALKNVQLVRAWAALRVMTPDGKPVYQQSETYPGAYGVACHSGVTLAAIHANVLANWISGIDHHPLIREFSSTRFNVQTAC